MKNIVKEQQLDVLSSQFTDINVASISAINTSSFSLFLLLTLFIGLLLFSNLLQDKDSSKKKKKSQVNYCDSGNHSNERTCESFSNWLSWDSSNSDNSECTSSSDFGESYSDSSCDIGDY